MKMRIVKLIALLLFSIMMCSILFTVSAKNNSMFLRTIKWEDKISEELWDEMNKKSNDEIIEIWLWITKADSDTIKNTLIDEKGLDPDVFENENRFQEEIIPKITRQAEKRIEQKESHRTISSELNEKNNEDYLKVKFDDKLDIINAESHAKVNEFIMAKREISRREQTAINNKFINDNIDTKNRKIIYNGEFTPSIIVEATKSETITYAKNKNVYDISLHINYPLISQADIEHETKQINADNYRGVKSGHFNNGTGYKGKHCIASDKPNGVCPVLGNVLCSETSVRIGILENNNVYDHTLSQFSDIHNKRLFKPNYPGKPTPGTNNSHANIVTSLVVGQYATEIRNAGIQKSEGIIPWATVYQVNVNHLTNNVLPAIKALVNSYNVNIINISFGLNTGNSDYNNADREIDHYSNQYNLTIVVSAGNRGKDEHNNDYKVISPGKGLNVITVGNAATKSSGFTMLSPKYEMHSTSSYVIPNYSPNKPDISAPGTFIGYANTRRITDSGASQSFTPGTSWSAPIVTGVIAQMIQANPNLKSNPVLLKARLLLAADRSKMSETAASGNLGRSGNAPFRIKSGAGLVDAVSAVRTSQPSTSITTSSNKITSTGIWNPPSGSHYLQEGQKIRAVMVYNKRNDRTISSQNHLDKLHLELRDPFGNLVASATNDRDNVKIIEHTATTWGTYNFRVVTEQLVTNESNNKIEGVDVRIAYDICEYPINYYPNGGNVIPLANQTQTKKYNQNLTLNNYMPVHGSTTFRNYSFLGWAGSSTSPSSSTVLYQPGDIYNANIDKNFYAIWDDVGNNMHYAHDFGTISSTAITNIDKKLETPDDVDVYIFTAPTVNIYEITVPNATGNVKLGLYSSTPGLIVEDTNVGKTLRITYNNLWANSTYYLYIQNTNSTTNNTGAYTINVRRM